MSAKPPVSAFPQPDTYHPNGQVQFGVPGMTLRDYFAIQFAVRFDASPTEAYKYADDMMVAREEAKP